MATTTTDKLYVIMYAVMTAEINVFLVVAEAHVCCNYGMHVWYAYCRIRDIEDLKSRPSPEPVVQVGIPVR